MRPQGRLIAAALIISVMFVAAPALAQDVEEVVRETVVYQKKTVVSFEDDTIDGDLTRPDGEYITARKRVRHSNLIKIRDNFRTRVLRSVSRL